MNFKNINLLLLFIFIFFLTNAQTVKTFAGLQTDTPKYNVNALTIRNFPKDSAYFSAPMGIEIDTAGRIYISNEHNIYFIYNGIARLVAGYALDPTDGGAAQSKDGIGIVARFSRPAGLALNPTTNDIYVADMDNNQVRLVEHFINNSTNQTVSTHAGFFTLNGGHLDGTNAAAKFSQPIGIARASNGDIYIADRANHCIRKISNGNVTTIAGKVGVIGNANGIGTNASFSAPFNLILDGNSLLVADFGNSAIRKIDLSNNNVTDLITTGLFGPTDLCKVNNTLFIAEKLTVKKYEGNVLSLYAGNGNDNGYADGLGVAARFEEISGIVFNPKDGFLYVADMGNNVIRTISPNTRPVCNFVVSSTAVTKGQTVILKNTSTGKPKTFKWTITPTSYTLLNNSKLTDSILYLACNQTGAYTVKLFVSNDVGMDSLQKNGYITVSSVTAKPNVDFYATNIVPALNEIIDLIDISANEPLTWKWRISPLTFIWQGGTDSTSRIPKVRFTNGSNYTVTLIAGNGQGSNSLTKTAYIMVNASSLNYLQTGKGLVYYPNPSNAELTIENATDGVIKIIDMQGKIVLSQQVSDTNNIIQVSSLSNGCFISVFIDSNGRQYTNKLIISR